MALKRRTLPPSLFRKSAARCNQLIQSTSCSDSSLNSKRKRISRSESAGTAKDIAISSPRESNQQQKVSAADFEVNVKVRKEGLENNVIFLSESSNLEQREKELRNNVISAAKSVKMDVKNEELRNDVISASEPVDIEIKDYQIRNITSKLEQELPASALARSTLRLNEQAPTNTRNLGDRSPSSNSLSSVDVFDSIDMVPDLSSTEARRRRLDLAKLPPGPIADDEAETCSDSDLSTVDDPAQFPVVNRSNMEQPANSDQSVFLQGISTNVRTLTTSEFLPKLSKF